MATEENELRHGVGGAVFDNAARLAFGRAQVRMFCLCDFNSGPCDTFEEAGAALDEHLGLPSEVDR